MKNDEWVGCEALVRWQNEKFGFLSPSNFIDLFEKNGFIIKLDHYVFKTVCRDLRRSLDAGDKVVPVSVNLSKRHFENDDFLSFYERILNKYQIPRNLIEFEITESMDIKNVKKMRECVEKIHKLGCSCSLDDFGVGYTSLDMVMGIKLDAIKLDASLFKDDDRLKRIGWVIVETLINLSHKLGAIVIAEGIENIEQVEMLKKLNCDCVQGYIFAKPESIYELKCMLNEISE